MYLVPILTESLNPGSWVFGVWKILGGLGVLNYRSFKGSSVLSVFELKGLRDLLLSGRGVVKLWVIRLPGILGGSGDLVSSYCRDL